MAARLHLARAPQFVLGDDEVGEEIGARNHAVRRDDFAELQWKRIERAPQLAFDDEERRVQPELVPLSLMSRTAIEILECQALDDGACVRARRRRRPPS